MSDDVKRRSEGLSLAPVSQAKSSLKYPYNFIFLLSWQTSNPVSLAGTGGINSQCWVLINRNWTAERKTAGKFPIILHSAFYFLLFKKFY